MLLGRFGQGQGHLAPHQRSGALCREYRVRFAAAITVTSCPELAGKLQVTAVVNMRAEYQDAFGDPMPAAYLWLPAADHTAPTAQQLRAGPAANFDPVQNGERALNNLGGGLSGQAGAANRFRDPAVKARVIAGVGQFLEMWYDNDMYFHLHSL